MLTAYLEAAMRSAHYELLPVLAGVELAVKEAAV